MPLDRALVDQRLIRLEKCLLRLEQVAAEPLDRFLSDHDLQDKAERNFQIAAQCCIDIGSHIVAAQGMGAPETYSDVFHVLGEAGVLPTDFAYRFAAIAGFRNLLVHEYVKINPERVYRNLELLDDFRRFAGFIVAYIERS